MPGSTLLIWGIAALATFLVIARPFGWPEAVWAVSGAALLVVLGLLTPAEALAGAGKGLDVYLFLLGMMLLAEVARKEGLFDWLAALATRRARGSARRLFFLVYAVGTVVTVFLSNDATAVVLTPAVAAAMRTAKAEKPLPYLLICAFIANAASFVLPISNPANLVIYGAQMPELWRWLPRFALPSLLSIGATYLVLRLTQRRALSQAIASDVPVPRLNPAGRTATYGIIVTAAVLLAASAKGIQLGLPTAVCGVITALVVLLRERKSPFDTVRDISWGVLALVAGLFVLVEALDKTGLIAMIARTLPGTGSRGAAWAAAALTGFGCNLTNNLPAGLVAADVLHSANAPLRLRSAVLVAVDVGPNLSVTGSLATILWLTALRREGQRVSAWEFLKLGALVMPPALFFALAAVIHLP
ncbi:MAG TPA: arsenic transporter [Myxococcales bacterium]|jgi:arsenical pump membrane protein